MMSSSEGYFLVVGGWKHSSLSDGAFIVCAGMPPETRSNSWDSSKRAKNGRAASRGDVCEGCFGFF